MITTHASAMRLSHKILQCFWDKQVDLGFDLQHTLMLETASAIEQAHLLPSKLSASSLFRIAQGVNSRQQHITREISNRYKAEGQQSKRGKHSQFMCPRCSKVLKFSKSGFLVQTGPPSMAFGFHHSYRRGHFSNTSCTIPAAALQ
ncbi:hypothetical protein ABBQ38_012936 [Trebouxia sp. C0009 RCD-2024]